MTKTKNKDTPLTCRPLKGENDKRNISINFHDQFRTARAVALRNAEEYSELLFTVERLGSYLKPDGHGLNDYKPCLKCLAKASDLFEISERYREWHMPFDSLFDTVKDGRNDALHQGAFARHLTTHAIQLALILEDALMSDAVTVGDYMVRNPVCAEMWQPVSFVRQQMLEESFSYLPILYSPTHWGLISDVEVAKYLRGVTSKTQRKERLAKTLKEVLITTASADNQDAMILIEDAHSCVPDDTVDSVVKKEGFDGKPILVYSRDKPTSLMGILTAFDLL